MKEFFTIMSFRICMCLFSAYALIPIVSNAQPVHTGLHYFSTSNGLSNNHIRAIVQDQRGFLWLATDEGLNRYDGTAFTAFFHKRNDNHSLPSNNVGDMALLPGNRLLLATNDGLCLFNTITHQGHTFHEKDFPKLYSFNNDFQFVRYDGQHHVWAASHTMLYLFDDSLHLMKKWKNPLIKTRPYVYAEAPFTYPDGKPGFLLNRIPYKFNPQTRDLERDSLLQKAINDHSDVDFIAGNQYGIWWLYSNRDTLFHLDNKKTIHAYPCFIPGAGKRRLSFLATRKDSILWCGDNCGYLIGFNMNKNKFLPDYFHFDNAPSIGTWVFTTSMLWDREQNLWMGTVNGLYKYNAGKRHLQILDTGFYFKNAPVKTADVTSFLKTGESYWVGTYGSGLYRINPVKKISRHFHFHFNYKETGRNWIWHIFPLTKDTLWLSTQDGLMWFNKKNYNYGMVRGHGLPSFIDTFTVMTMFKDSHDFLWMGMSNGHGLIRYDQKTKQTFIYKKSDIPIPDVSCITEDENGDLWMAFMFGGGIIHWHRKTGQFSVIRAHSNSVFNDDKIYTIYADKQGSVWFSAGADGLGQYQIATDSIRIYGRAEGLCSQLINSITGYKNHLWIATSNGLSKFNRTTKQFKNYTAVDGFPGNYFVYVDCREDTVYACGSLSMTKFRDGELVSNPYPPSVYITGMQVENRPVFFQAGKKIRIKYNQNYVRFDYSGINYVHGTQNQYAYKLDGAGSGWVNAGHNRYAVYAGLAPGTYTFRVKAANSAGLWSKNTALCTFVVVPPFWKTTWFLLAVFLLIFGLIYFFYRYRLRSVMRLQGIRDRIASDLHDDMGASLSNINILSTMALQKQRKTGTLLNKMLENIREDAQQMSEAIDDIVWMVNPKNDSPEKILARIRYYASELFEAKNIKYEIYFPLEADRIKLSMEKRRELFLILKEAVNNLVKHSGCTKAVLRIETEGNRLRVQLSDNGKGFDVEKEFEGNGLKNICRRAKSIGGKIEIVSECGKGSCLTLVL